MGVMRKVLVVVGAACWLATPGVATAATLPSGFTDTVVFSGLNEPTAIRFSPDGRIFIAQKNGLIKEFDSLSDTTPTIVADLSTETDDFWDRGLLGLALDPNFPTSPYMYVLESYDAAIGGTAPQWNDNCPTPPGATTDGCVISGRLLRLTLSGNTVTSTKILIKDEWCQQYPSHSIGDLNFGADGALYVSGGDGASFNFADYGQGGGSSGSPTPKNPCGDPPAGVGGTMTPPTAEGGALRSQSLRRPSGEPVLLNGAILRVDPATGDALPDNPNAASSDPNARRIVAYGLRNPFRFTIRPLSNDLWIGDVGWNSWEEIDRQPSPTSSVLNFGWPCYEGNAPQPGYQSAGLNLCTSLYSAGTATAPYFTYNHSDHIVSTDSCPTGSSSVTGLAFYTGASNYPAAYANGLFFADYSRNCISFMPVGANGLPDPTRVQAFEAGAGGPVDLEIGPNGDLFYVDLNSAAVHEIKYTGANNPPTAIATASPTSGVAPLTVAFDGSGSSDPDPGDTISYSWDLNGDGTYGDSTAAKPSYTYSSVGTYTVRLKVTDNHGAATISAPITITVTSAGQSTFGTTTPGASTDTASVGLKEVSKYTAPQPGTVLKLTGYVSGLGATSGTQPLRAVVYADSSGNPGALLGVSNEVVIAAGQPWGWVDFTFPSGVSINAGTVWLGYIGGSVSDLAQLRYDEAPGELRYNANPGGYAAGPSNPFGSPIQSHMHYSLYATYVPSGATNNPPVATATAAPTSGSAPLTVSFDGSGSYDPDPGDTISYSWDLDGNGVFGDAVTAKPSYTYAAPGTYNAVLKVTDNHGASTLSSPIPITVSSGSTSTFGTTTPGVAIDTASADLKEVSKYTAPQAGSVLKLTGYLSGLGMATGTQKVRGVIYADSSGSPGALLGVSNEVTVSAGQPWGWVDFSFTPAVPIQAGTIWLGYIASSASDLTQLRYDPLSNDLRFNVNSYASGPSNPFGSTFVSSKHYSLYATYTPANNPPLAVATAAPTSGSAPLTVSFDGSGSSDPDPGDSISYSWDLDGDGTFGDSTVAKPSYTYTQNGTYTVKLKVTDSHGASTVSSPITITVGNQPPVPTITSPQSTLTWKVGDLITFSGGATDPEDGTLPASALTWQLLLHHCDPTGQTCHIHYLQTFTGVSSGSFNAPDHDYPSYLELQLTATDSSGATATTSVALQPQTVGLTLASTPPGLQLALDSVSQATPFTTTVIVGSTHSVSAVSSQTLGGVTYTFSSWSDGGAATHNVTAPATATTYTATYTGTDHPPTATATASPTSGNVPLTVSFDGSGSSDPDPGDTLSYSWDLNGDGTYGDSTAATPTYTYTTPGTYAVRLKVTDPSGMSATSSPITITATGTFGTTSIGSSVDYADANVKEVAKYTAVAGKVLKLTGYISGLGSTSGSQKLRAVIYANSNGAPGALLGVSSEVTVNAGQQWGWVTFSFPSPVSVSAGTIWLGYIGSTKHDLTQLRYDPIVGDMRYNTNSGGYAAGPTNPFGAAAISNKHYSLYATYLP